MKLETRWLALISLCAFAACGAKPIGGGSGGADTSGGLGGSMGTTSTTTTTQAGTTTNGATSAATTTAVSTSCGATSVAASGSSSSGMPSSMNGCGVADYMDMTQGSDNDRMIMTMGSGFDMPCMTILAGQAVMFMWDFAQYPLAAGDSPDHAGDPPGDQPSPIPSKSSGQTISVQFPKAGMFPFYVPGQTGMTGVVEVQ